MTRSDISRNWLFWHPDPEGSTGRTSASGLGQVSMVMLPLPVHGKSCSEPGWEENFLDSFHDFFSFSVPFRSAVPGCSIADRFLTGSGFSRDAASGSVRGLSRSPSCHSITASPQVRRTLGRSCQLSAVSSAASSSEEGFKVHKACKYLIP